MIVMSKGLLNPKYIRVEVRIGLIIRKGIRTGLIVGTGVNLQIVGPDRTIEMAIFKETLEGMVGKIIEEDTEMIDIMISNRGRNRSRERTFTRNYSSGRDKN